MFCLVCRAELHGVGVRAGLGWSFAAVKKTLPGCPHPFSLKDAEIRFATPRCSNAHLMRVSRMPSAVDKSLHISVSKDVSKYESSSTQCLGIRYCPARTTSRRHSSVHDAPGKPGCFLER